MGAGRPAGGGAAAAVVSDGSCSSLWVVYYCTLHRRSMIRHSLFLQGQSPRGVIQHVAAILAELQISSRTEHFRFATTSGHHGCRNL